MSLVVRVLRQWAEIWQYQVYNQTGCLPASCRRVSSAVAACWLLPLHSHRPARAIHARAVTCQLITIISIMPLYALNGEMQCLKWVSIDWLSGVNWDRIKAILGMNIWGRPLLTSLLIMAPLMIDIVEKIEETKFSLNFTIFSRNWIKFKSDEIKLNSN